MKTSQPTGTKLHQKTVESGVPSSLLVASWNGLCSMPCINTRRVTAFHSSNTTLFGADSNQPGWRAFRQVNKSEKLQNGSANMASVIQIQNSLMSLINPSMVRHIIKKLLAVMGQPAGIWFFWPTLPHVNIVLILS